MNKTLLIIIFTSILCFSCEAQNEKTIVENFIKSYNKKDSISTLKYLHRDFVEFFEIVKDLDSTIAITNKSDYSKNYAWGKVMNDSISFQIIKVDNAEIETLSTYYSDRDSILKVNPYKSIRTYYIKDMQIFKIVESKFSGYENYDNPRREKYSKFFDWVFQKHELTIDDFEFNKKGADKLRKILIEYSERK